MVSKGNNFSYAEVDKQVELKNKQPKFSVEQTSLKYWAMFYYNKGTIVSPGKTY